MELLAEKPRYTFADCLTRNESERIEVINGESVQGLPGGMTVSRNGTCTNRPGFGNTGL